MLFQMQIGHCASSNVLCCEPKCPEVTLCMEQFSVQCGRSTHVRDTSIIFVACSRVVTEVAMKNALNVKRALLWVSTGIFLCEERKCHNLFCRVIKMFILKVFSRS